MLSLRERENIFYVHRTETGIAWRFAFRENKNKTLDIRRLVRRLRLPASLLSFFFFFFLLLLLLLLLLLYLFDTGKLSRLRILQIKNSHFLSERYSHCRVLEWLRTTSVSRRRTTCGVGEHDVSQHCHVYRAVSTKKSFNERNTKRNIVTCGRYLIYIDIMKRCLFLLKFSL